MDVESYNKLKANGVFQDPLDFVYATEYNVVPSKADYDKGIIKRYFVKKVNSDIITETSADNFREVATLLYSKVAIDWKISGNITSIYVNGVMQVEGIDVFNKRQIKEGEKVLSNLGKILNNPLQFVKL